MHVEYPLKFTLDDGVHVVVNKTGENTFDFSLSSEKRGESHFTYVDDDRPRDVKSEHLDFDQLNALRRFWLDQEEVI